MEKSELVSAVASSAKLSTAEAKVAVEAMVAVVTDELKRGNDIHVAGFGNFVATGLTWMGEGSVPPFSTFKPAAHRAEGGSDARADSRAEEVVDAFSALARVAVSIEQEAKLAREFNQRLAKRAADIAESQARIRDNLARLDI